MKRIAITGISGYIGTGLAHRLESIDAVELIVGIDRHPPQIPCSSKLRFYQLDVCQPFMDIFVDNNVDAAIHLAFILMPKHDRDAARCVNVGGALNFLHACRTQAVKRILYLSSHTIYGAHPDNPIPLTEDSPPRPMPGFQYSWDKAETERIFLDFAASNPDICVTILRTCVVMGPNADNAITKSLFKPAMICISGYDPPMQFVHENDLTELILTFLERKQPGVFNVAGEEMIRYRQLATLCGKRLIPLPAGPLNFVMNLSWKLHLQKESPAAGLDFIKYPVIISTEKLKREVGFRFRYSSQEAVASFISAIKPSSTDNSPTCAP
jgi:UDP-glucose 4-epimerase